MSILIILKVYHETLNIGIQSASDKSSDPDLYMEPSTRYSLIAAGVKL